MLWAAAKQIHSHIFVSCCLSLKWPLTGQALILIPPFVRAVNERHTKSTALLLCDLVFCIFNYTRACGEGEEAKT